MRRIANVALAATAFVVFGASAASAQVITGTIDTSDPTMVAVTISTPNCTPGVGVPPGIHYDLIPFTVTTSGSYTATMVGQNNWVGFYLHAGSFQPASSFSTCIAARPDNGSLTVALTVGTQYFAVPMNANISQGTTLPYTLTFTGPAPIVIAAVPALPWWAYPPLVLALALVARKMLRGRSIGTAQPA